MNVPPVRLLHSTCSLALVLGTAQDIPKTPMVPNAEVPGCGSCPSDANARGQNGTVSGAFRRLARLQESPVIMAISHKTSVFFGKSR